MSSRTLIERDALVDYRNAGELKFVPTRNGFGEGLIEAGDRNHKRAGNLRRSRGIDAHGRLQESAPGAIHRDRRG